jgi:hypothetical protein
MTGGFVDQLTDVGKAGLLVGSLMHVAGLIAAIVGGIAMITGGRGAAERER